MHNLTAHELSSVHHLDLLIVIVTFKKMYVCCNYGKCNHYGKLIMASVIMVNVITLWKM